jgi:hypothetical protein
LGVCRWLAQPPAHPSACPRSAPKHVTAHAQASTGADEMPHNSGGDAWPPPSASVATGPSLALLPGCASWRNMTSALRTLLSLPETILEEPSGEAPLSATASLSASSSALEARALDGTSLSGDRAAAHSKHGIDNEAEAGVATTKGSPRTTSLSGSSSGLARICLPRSQNGGGAAVGAGEDSSNASARVRRLELASNDHLTLPVPADAVVAGRTIAGREASARHS